MTRLLLAAAAVLVFNADAALAQPPKPTLVPLVRVVDLGLGESEEVELCDGQKVAVRLLELEETADPVRGAIRQARVHVQIDGRKVWLRSANYELPQTVGRVRVDCPITGGYRKNSRPDAWGLDKDARLRLWPAGSPLMKPGTFAYPVRQRWFASATQMANEPCYVDAAESPKNRNIYYHYGLDFGGAEGMVEVVAATDGLVVSSGTSVLAGYQDTPVKPRYDVVYLLDARGWYYRYSHMISIDPAIRPGATVRMGQPIGVLGKEGGSGGWSHQHFDVFCRQPSGKWGCQEAYAFAWEAYHAEYRPKLIAVARPHHLALTGEPVVLDASRSWTAAEKIVRFEWTFTDGAKAAGPKVSRTYERPGYYSEILKITDSAGQTDYDFAVVVVLDRGQPDRLPPSLHLVYYPTFHIKPGAEVTFKARTFGTTDGEEEWDFGDGSQGAKTRSDGNVKPLAADGYAVLKHAFAKPGHYLVRARRTDRFGQTATAHVAVRVGEE